MDVCLGPAEIGALLAGTLSAEEKARAETHLSECARCRQECQARQEEDRLFRVIKNVHQVETLVSPGESATVPGETGRPVSAAPTAESIPGYTLLSEIHRGGQGVVYKAVQQSAKRTVALKLLLPGLYASPSQRQRFEREINLVASLRHPHIVTLYDSGVTAEGRHFFAMEYIHGRSLSAYLARDDLGQDARLALFGKICAAVGYAHQRGVVHRDLKPGNILIDELGEPHVVDFGLAKSAAAELADGLPVTRTGEFMGTLAYASPEQTKGDPNLIDPRSDVYALGVMLYEALTGQLPYAITGPLPDVLRNIAYAEPGKPSALDRRIDHEVETIVLTALAKDPQCRYSSAGEMGEDLRLYREGLPIRAKRASAAYVLGKQTRRVLARHAVASCIGVGVLAWVLAYAALGVRFPFRLIDRPFESAAIALRYRLVSAPWPKELTVVALNDATYATLGELAARENLEEVSVDDTKSWRALHGVLMRRLAQVRPKIVAWDILFHTPQPRFDDRFLAGMKALQAAGAKVILGYARTGDQNRPLLSSPLAGQADSQGSVYLYETAGMVRSVTLGLEQAPYPIAPSFALAVFAAYRHPGYTPHLVWDADAPSLEVRYFQGAPDDPAGTRWLSTVDRIRIAHQREEPAKKVADAAEAGLHRDAFLWTTVPGPEVLARHTVPYQEVFAADETRLREWFEGKIIIIGDNRLHTTSSPDRRRLADGAGGRDEFSCYMHAAALRDLLTGVSLTLWPPDLARGTLLFAVVLGLGVGTKLRRVPGWLYRGIVGVLLLVLLVGIGLAVAVGYGVVVRPSSVILALLVSAAGAAWIDSLSKGRYRRSA